MTAPVTIAVGYDGSPDAGCGVAWAARVADALGARLHIVHAVGLLEHAGLAGHVGVDGDAAVGIALEAGIVPATSSGLSSTATRARRCSAWPRAQSGPPCSWSAPGDRVPMPAR